MKNAVYRKELLPKLKIEFCEQWFSEPLVHSDMLKLHLFYKSGPECWHNENLKFNCCLIYTGTLLCKEFLSVWEETNSIILREIINSVISVAAAAIRDPGFFWKLPKAKAFHNTTDNLQWGWPWSWCQCHDAREVLYSCNVFFLCFLD